MLQPGRYSEADLEELRVKRHEAQHHRLALNKLFRKSGVNRYTECRVCNFKDRSVIVVNAACEDEQSYKITEVVLSYREQHKDVHMLIGNYVYPMDPSNNRLWVLV